MFIRIWNTISILEEYRRLEQNLAVPRPWKGQQYLQVIKNLQHISGRQQHLCCVTWRQKVLIPWIIITKAASLFLRVYRPERVISLMRDIERNLLCAHYKIPARGPPHITRLVTIGRGTPLLSDKTPPPIQACQEGQWADTEQSEFLGSQGVQTQYREQRRPKPQENQYSVCCIGNKLLRFGSLPEALY